MALRFNTESPDVHTCVCERQGEWLIFTCPKCKGYERRFNYTTGEMHLRTGTPRQAGIPHEGVFQPPGFEVGGTGVN